jgi:hypothetical protein
MIFGRSFVSPAPKRYSHSFLPGSWETDLGEHRETGEG